MKTDDIKRIIDAGLSEVQTTERDVNAVMEYVLSADSARRPSLSFRSKVVRAVLAAVLLVLLLSVAAQAFGIPVWRMFLNKTDEEFEMRILKDEADGSFPLLVKMEFTDGERKAWGEEVCSEYEKNGFYPVLPEWKPDGFEPEDIFVMTDEFGGAYASMLYEGEDDRNFVITVERMGDPEFFHSYVGGIVSDENDAKARSIDGVEYMYGTNLDNTWITWMYADLMYTMFSTEDFDMCWKMIESMRYDQADIEWVAVQPE